MVTILDMCCGKWEQEMGGGTGMEITHTGNLSGVMRPAADPGLSQRVPEPVAMSMPPPLLDRDMDEFLRGMRGV